MALRLRFTKATRREREDQNEFNRAQQFEARFMGRFEARFREAVRLLDAAVTNTILREAAVSLNPDVIFTAWDKVDAYAPLVKTALAKVSAISFEESLNILLAELMAAKGQLELSRLKQKLGRGRRGQLFDFQFDLTNPFTIPWVRNHRLELVREIDDSTRAAIRDVMVSMVEEGVTVAQASRRLRASIGLTSRQAAALSKTARIALENGATSAQVTRILDLGRKRAIRFRAESIARTEITRAESAAQAQAWDIAVAEGVLDADVKRRWIAGNPPRTDELCLELEANDPVGLGETFTAQGQEFVRPPAHPQCLPGDTAVAALSVSGISERWYDGDVVVISTARGNQLTCTPNHPILTDHGWIPASDLCPSCHVVCDISRQWKPTINGDHEDMPPLIHHVAKTYRGSIKMGSIEVPASTEDFHGDGSTSEITVIWSDGKLRHRFNASDTEKTFHRLLKGRTFPGTLEAFCSCNQFSNRDSAAPSRIIGSTGQSSTLFESRLGHADPHGLRSAPRSDPSSKQSESYDLAADCESCRERLLGNAFTVKLDDVVSVKIKSFHGHVYNMDTAEGLYFAEGIAVHNCRCTIVLDL